MKTILDLRLLTLALLIAFSARSQDKKYRILTVAFYNQENLFDIEDDPNKLDERSPIMEMDSTARPDVYKKKIANMAKVISKIGTDFAGVPPAIIGVCEVENDDVLLDLVNHPRLRPFNYGVIHYDLPDERSIDTGLLYQKSQFIPTNSVAHEVKIFYGIDKSKRNYTRDVLVVSGKLRGEDFHFIVNHWPSRSGGQKRSEPGRLTVAKVTKKAIDSLQAIDPYAKIMVMGDFNDGPYNKSIAEVIGAKFNKEEVGFKEFYNPYEEIRKKGGGTIAYRGSWDIFDQIFFSEPLLNSEDYSEFRYYKSGVFAPTFLQTPKGRWKGYPYRSFAGGFTGGYSDHFPVFVYLIREIEEDK
ncbi:endonuclease/exonuclease/phosphatase family protein [Flavobacterium sp. CS20]|uniref:endonuclease/exonuclease/phosphatase family protein n=1 Tax=Flavobacterium sp. CS20 TaxID=2775246 RepID=UPI001B3A582F|nr:endonuclease/exonuclease/phosphatase family protein [Flavobacterium sp. CS20]QTY26595.1 endonuclease/exonuclease/phosphatase family protein [Flavobacterium sp. CS20]